MTPKNKPKLTRGQQIAAKKLADPVYAEKCRERDRLYRDKMNQDPERRQRYLEKCSNFSKRRHEKRMALPPEERRKFYAERWEKWKKNATPEQRAAKREQVRQTTYRYYRTEQGRSNLAKWKKARGKADRLPLGEYMRKELLSNQLYASVTKLVGRKYSPSIREDVIMEIVLAIWEGSVTLETVVVSKFVPAYWNEGYRNRSTSEELSDGFTLGDTLRAPEREEDYD